MKKSILRFSAALASVAILAITGCEKTDNNYKPKTTTKYVLMTMSTRTVNTKPGNITAYNAMPTGTVNNNNDSSFQGLGMGGWRFYNNMLMKMFSSSDNKQGIQYVTIPASGKISDGTFIAGLSTISGTGNFVVATDDKGFYWDGNDPLKIQTFDAGSKQRTGSIDFASVVNERGATDKDITFRAIGRKFLAVKEGKLFADITYAKTTGPQQGFFDDYYPDVYLAVIDAKTGAYEKTIKIPATGSIAYVNENNMYAFDTNGDLYIVTQGRSVTGGQSKISRIKAGSTDIDPNWSLNMDDIMTDGKFVSVFAKQGKLITLIPKAPLTRQTINSEDTWEFYVVNVSDKSRNKIKNVPAIVNPGASLCAVEIDGKTLLRVANKDLSTNGYFDYNWKDNAATSLFQVDGGQVQAFQKIEISL